MKKIAIAICGTSGAGKTSLVKSLAHEIPGSESFYFDDYAEYPESMEEWLRDGADPCKWKSPQMLNDFRVLMNGDKVRLSKRARLHREAVGERTKENLCVSRFLFIEEPFGRARVGFSELIDYVIGIDIPLDVSLSRKLLRDIKYSESGVTGNDALITVKQILASYEAVDRHLYLSVTPIIKDADLVVDGTGDKDIIKEKVKEEILRNFGMGHRE